MLENRFASNADEIRFYVKEFLADGKAHERIDIIHYVSKHAPNGPKFTEGMFTGAIRDLLKKSKGDYINPSRGIYQYIGPKYDGRTNSELRSKVTDVLNDTCKSLEHACVINVINIHQDDIKIAKLAASIIDQLKKDIITINEI